MPTIKNFEDLQVWQLAREFANDIYGATGEGSFATDFKLKNQINGSAGSIMDNIAEGFERDGNKEFAQFLSIAKGSVGETRSQLHRALDREHIDKENFDVLVTKAIAISKQLSGLMRYLKSSDVRGLKYLEEPFEDYSQSDI